MLGPLCGPGAIVFLPLFVLRALVERDRQRTLQALILGAGAAVQLLIFYGASPVRGVAVEPSVLLASLFIRLVVLPLGGPLSMALLGLAAREDQVAGGTLVMQLAAASIVTMILVILWVLQRRDNARWLFAAALLVAFVSLGLGSIARPEVASRIALSGIAGARYNFLPVALLSLTVLALEAREVGWSYKLAKCLTAALLLVAATFYPLTSPLYKRGPSWSAEVTTWRANPTYGLVAWPKDYRADLSGRRFKCPNRAVPPGDAAHPRYCESGWLTSFYPSRYKQQ
jgi:hypothetical protein